MARVHIFPKLQHLRPIVVKMVVIPWEVVPAPSIVDEFLHQQPEAPQMKILRTIINQLKLAHKLDEWLNTAMKSC